MVQRIKAIEGQTRLLVVDKDTDEELRRRQLTCTEDMAHQGLPPAHDPWEPKLDWVPAGGLGSEASQKVGWAQPALGILSWPPHWLTFPLAITGASLPIALVRWDAARQLGPDSTLGFPLMKP